MGWLTWVGGLASPGTESTGSGVVWAVGALVNEEEQQALVGEEGMWAEKDQVGQLIVRQDRNMLVSCVVLGSMSLRLHMSRDELIRVDWDHWFL